MERAGSPAFLLALLVGPIGCASPGTEGGQRALVLPLAPQSAERFQCGPSTLASVMAFHGQPVPEARIAEAIYSPTAKGVLLHDMAWFARKQGFEADVRSGNLDDLKLALQEEHPPIILLDLGISRIRKPHFTALTGVTDGGIFQIGPKRADDYVRMEVFARQWKRAGNQVLVIRPAALPPP